MSKRKKMDRRDFLKKIALTVSAISLYGCNSSSPTRKPNIILMMTDDQGFGDLAFYENEKIDTPTLDQFATQGARFNRFFVSPVCAPTRASVLTGRYHLRTATSWVTRGKENMRTEETTIAEILQKNGYVTGCFGKWHNGAHYPEHPNGQGFDEFLGFCAGHWNNYFDPDLEHNGKMVKCNGYITEILTEKAIEFISQNKNKPFFCYIPYNAPHTPTQVPDKYFLKYKDQGFDNHTAAIYGMIENLDENIQRILQEVEKQQMVEDTIVIFLTDNGPNGVRFNGGMKGIKGSVDEGGVRVPMFIRWPGKIEPGKIIEENAAHIDLLPTITDLCGIFLDKSIELDGISLKPLLLGRDQVWPDRMIFTFPHGNEISLNRPGAVRTQKWRAIYKNRKWELFNIQNDPSQKNDLATDSLYKSILDSLSKAYFQKYEEVTQNGLDVLPIQVGYSDWPLVTFPAHEAFLYPESGAGISYTMDPGYANHWISSWTDKNAYPWWKIKVVQSGNYQISLLYTCSEASVGTTINLSIGGKSLTKGIQEAFNPPLKKLAHRDEVEFYRYQSKEWKVFEMGTIFLRKGFEGKLLVKTDTKPGRYSIDLKEVQLIRVG
jgi:arylsulfatase A-like enzyme